MAQKQKLNKTLLIGFGDNHGEIRGGDIGYTMDYTGRRTNINNNDLIIFTKQNR